MRIRFSKTSVLAVVLCLIGASSVDGQSPDGLAGRRIEAGTFFGAMISGKEISRGVNATGGERLIARLNHSAALSVRVGLHSDLLGLEASVLTTSSRAEVKNEVGVAFPNHAERPLFFSGDALLYPFRRAIRAGKIRPYLTSGFGGMVLSADLDNIRDKEMHGSLMWNAGGGIKVFVSEGTGLYFDLRFTNHRLLDVDDKNGLDLRSVSIGVGARF